MDSLMELVHGVWRACMGGREHILARWRALFPTRELQHASRGNLA
jgi:hypothetical protein